MVSIVVVFSLLALIPLPADARWIGTSLSPSSRMPAPFSFATADDALAATYPSYVRSLGIARELRTTDGNAAHVSILEAAPWYSGGKPFLVVAVARQTSAEVREGFLCGGCWERFAVAVLAERDNALHLVARTHDDGPTEADPVPGGVEPDLSFKGDGETSLDLAPYRLSRRETLIGLRNTWSVTGGSFSTTLVLFRIVGNDLKGVAEIPIAGGTEVPEKTLDHGTVLVTPGPGPYDDLRVITRHWNATSGLGDEYYYDLIPSVKPAGSDVSTFRFDGVRFKQIAAAKR
jgi:hypothetical protein